MNCKDCKYCKYGGKGISGGYKCDHKEIYKSANQYEKSTGKRISKAPWHVGYKMIKTSLRHCPLNMGKVG